MTREQSNPIAGLRTLLMLTGVVSSRTLTKTARLTDIGGVGKQMALTNGLYLLGGLALAGIPPLNGFISKVALKLSLTPFLSL